MSTTVVPTRSPTRQLFPVSVHFRVLSFTVQPVMV